MLIRVLLYVFKTTCLSSVMMNQFHNLKSPSGTLTLMWNMHLSIEKDRGLFYTHFVVL